MNTYHDNFPQKQGRRVWTQRLASPLDWMGTLLLKRVVTQFSAGPLTVITPGGRTLVNRAVTAQALTAQAETTDGETPQAATGATASASSEIARTRPSTGAHCPPPVSTLAPPPLPLAPATLIMHRWRMLWRLLREGDIGFAESYMDGDWSSPDVAAVIALAARDREALAQTLEGSRFRQWQDRRAHCRRANTRSGSRRNIAEHYDLGNDFYSRWLDASMCYSSAVYRRDTLASRQSSQSRQAGAAVPAHEETLEEAQQRKLDVIEQQLQLQGNEHVLEIGCGWGALATRLAQRGCTVVALTLSDEQFAATKARVAEAGLSERVDVRLQDYRDVDGQFDRIVSIEMFEAVGQAYWDTYFGQVSARLRAGGLAVLQVITIAESRFAAYQDDVDFIQRYVFPGGMLPAPSHLDSVPRKAALELTDVHCFGASYAFTLAEWRRRFLREWQAVRAQGFDERFKRLWEYYLAYCEGGFASGAIDVGLYRYSKPRRS